MGVPHLASPVKDLHSTLSSRASAYAHVVRGGTLENCILILSLVIGSGLCGRTNSDRGACCVIDFNLKSAACCSPPHSLHIRRPAGPPSRGHLEGIPPIALL